MEDALRDQNELVRAQSLLAQYNIWHSLRNLDALTSEVVRLFFFLSSLAHLFWRRLVDLLTDNMRPIGQDRGCADRGSREEQR